MRSHLSRRSSALRPGKSPAGRLSLERLEDRTLLTATETLLTVSSTSAIYGQTETLTATIMSASPGTSIPGVVNFYDGSSLLGTGSVTQTSGYVFTAAYSTTALSLGTHSFTAVYQGGGASNGSQSAGVISTVAGNGSSGYGGENYPAMIGPIASSQGVAVDSAGNVYIADTYNQRIQEVVKATGLIKTVAGNGSASYNGDNIPATSASLYYPQGVVVDAAGNLFIADTFNNRIREVVKSTGNIITIAGTGGAGYNGDYFPATSATLNQPWGVAVDASDNVFIADTYDQRIREVVKATGLIKTVAGVGGGGYNGDNQPATSAYLNYPSGVALDGTGNVYISDLYNQRIRKVSQTTGLITTVAGNGAATFAGDGGSATNASFAYPQGLAVDPNGNIFLSDNTGRVREVTKSTGFISTVAGLGGNGYNGDYIGAQSAYVSNTWGLATDSSGNLFFNDTGNYRVRQVGEPNVVTVTAAPTTTTVVATPTATVLGQSVAFTATVATSSPSSATPTGTVQFQVDRTNFGSPVTLVNGTATTTATSSLAVGNHLVTAIFTAGTGFSNSSSGFAYNVPGNIISTVAGIGGTIGFFGDGGPATSATLFSPNGVVVDSSGNIYIADSNNNRIREVVKATGKIITIAGTGSASYTGDGGLAMAATFYYPSALAIDAAGNLYIVDEYNYAIRKITKATGIITTVAGNGMAGFSGDNGLATSAMLNNPTGVAVDSSGNIYIADAQNYRIRKVNTSGTITTFAGTGTSAYNGDGVAPTSANVNPRGVAVDSAANVYIADYGNSRIREVVQSTGLIKTFAGTGVTGFSGDNGQATSATLTYPQGVAVDSSGNVYIADSSNVRIRKVATSGVITTIAGTGVPGYNGDGIAATSAEITFDSGLAVDGSGNVLIADQANNRVREVIASSGLIATVAGNGYLAYNGDNVAATSASLGNPGGVAVDASGNVYIADTR